MKLGVLFSGGKDSVYAAYVAQKYGHSIECLISVFSRNKESYMFHTPSVEMTRRQAEVMGREIIIQESAGEKEVELDDLREAIRRAVEKYDIQGVVSGAIHSAYQASRIQKICDELEIECFNPLWLRDEKEYLEELLRAGFRVILVGVFAYPFDKSWILREVDKKFIREMEELHKEYGIHIAGEGGEFETLVLDCPLFAHPLEIERVKIKGEGENSYRAEVSLK